LETNNENKLEILEGNYWEHFKHAKDLALFLPVNHPKRKLLDKTLSEMVEKIHELKLIMK